MNVAKLTLTSNAAMPLIAALPYAVVVDGPEAEQPFTYDPATQLTRFAGRRDFSTCREDESVWGVFKPSRSDTKKDD